MVVGGRLSVHYSNPIIKLEITVSSTHTVRAQEIQLLINLANQHGWPTVCQLLLPKSLGNLVSINLTSQCGRPTV